MSKIKIRNLNKTYGKTVALNSINLDFSEGIYALLGHNGAGKSTLLNILSTTLAYDNGEISYNNQDLDEIGNLYRNRLGYMPQQQELIPFMTVKSFLVYMSVLKQLNKKQIQERVNIVMKQTNLDDIMHKKLTSLSGGMKQRVLIAQALLNEPEILLLDEPTAGLDPVQRMQLRKLIYEISLNKIVIIATHVISDVELIANKIIFMKDGNILANKTQEELIEETDVYESYMSIDELSKNDVTVKFVSAIQTNKGIKTRFISKKKYQNKVQTTLDDVYLDYLSNQEINESVNL